MAKQPRRVEPKPRLGRGLSSLIAPSSQPQTAEQAQYAPQHDADAPGPRPIAAAATQPAGGAARLELPVEQIAPNPYQPRREFPPEQLRQLAQSIRTQGILQPLLVKPARDAHSSKPYMLIAGERRLRAAQFAGLTQVPCIVRDASNREMLEWALIENIHREDLNPLERAEAYRQYIDRFGLTHAEAAERLGQQRATISNYLRILELEKDTQELLASGRISFGHAKVLAGLLNQPARQVKLARRAAAEGMSVRQLERTVQANPSAASSKRSVKEPYLVDLEQRLSRAVGTRVRIETARKKNTGRVVIDYYSLEDFDRIMAALGASLDE